MSHSIRERAGEIGASACEWRAVACYEVMALTGVSLPSTPVLLVNLAAGAVAETCVRLRMAVKYVQAHRRSRGATPVMPVSEGSA